ncbi:Carboxymuconolactone decarboxylase family protein [Saccharopolyspora shandongensis]|uniref:Carboxymuconolactone decarboxylase family protein n=1 Tax=Saccharopolyspora shandongensis TaxID=418495 RepID=A0A1H3IMZ7_9PSEU|nr:carboxymuconolactone decarboxylase family protein [Saccharopolyspora shandongensis]SDY28184.1 Carboxymuconolactone decarboxylase family protein [Saccharopolyspora shandongensis]
MSTPTTQRDDIKSRLPDPTDQFPELVKLSAAVLNATRNGSVPQSTLGLVRLRAGQIVGSTYHALRATENLRKAGESEERIIAVATWQDAPYFADAERVALELVEAVLTPNPFGERVSDELFARAAAHYDDQALWTLTMAIGHFCLFVPVALIGKPIPGRPPGKNYSK